MRKITILVALMILALSVSYTFAEMAELGADPSLIETVLAPNLPSALANFDLIPIPNNEISYTEFANLDLSPRNVVYGTGRSYLNPDFRTSSMGDKLFTASLVSLVVLNVADYFSTLDALKHPGLGEGNPLMKPFVKSPLVFAAVKAGISTLSFLSMKSIYKKNRPLAWVLSTAANFAMSYVVSNNLRLIDKIKGR
jgi:hypothetical protein